MGYLRVLVVLVLVVGMVVVGALKEFLVSGGSCLGFRLVHSIGRECRCIRCIGLCLLRVRFGGRRVDFEIDHHVGGRCVHDTRCLDFFDLFLDLLVRGVCGTLIECELLRAVSLLLYAML